MRLAGMLQQAVRVRRSGSSLILLILQGIQRHIQLHYIYHRLTEKTGQRRLRRLIHQAGDLLNTQIAGLRDARDLPERGRRREVIIQPACRCRHQLYRNARVSVRVGET